MQNSYLGLLGLAKRAGKVEVGDEATRASMNSKAARLVLIASDAAERTCETFEFLADNANIAHVRIAETRAELGNSIGKRPCAVVGICDIGFAGAIIKKIAEINPDAKETAEALTERVAKISARRNKGKKKK